MKRYPHTLKQLLFSLHREDFRDLKSFYRSAWMAWLLYVTLVLSCAAILTVVWWPLPSNIEVGSIATHDILSDQAYTIVDEVATKQLRDNALAKVLPIFTYNKSPGEKISGRLDDAFAAVRVKYRKMRAKAEGEKLLPPQVEELRTLFSDSLGVSISVRDFETLFDERWSEGLQIVLENTLQQTMNQPIIDNRSAVDSYVEKGIMLEEVEGDATRMKTVEGKDLSKIAALPLVKESLVLEAGGRTVPAEASEALLFLAKELLVPTVAFNQVATEKGRAEALSGVEDVLIRIQEGESIVRRGDRFEPRDISIIDGIKKAKVKRNFRLKFFGTFAFLFAFLLTLYVFAAIFIQRFRPTRKDLVFLGSALILMCSIYRIAFSISHAVSRTVPLEVPFSALHYVIPVAAGAMMVRMLRNATEAFVFALAIGVMIGFAPDTQFHYSVLFLVGSLVGAGTASRAHTRGALGRAGLYVGLAQVFMILTFELIHSTEVIATLSREAFFMNLGFGLLGGLMSAVVVLVFTPLAESAFNYLTDIKLLEMGNLNHPLLRELIVRAPGTYHHSHLVGTLAEAGAEAIGANALFARVASYFHDVGKMKKSGYFVENQGGGPSRHANLAPSMSALIIMNHVKDGMELARQYGLPEPIVDVIPQHQGTKLVSYFYSKAKEQENPEVSSVTEKDYRYPGPRPQTREGGIIMLADSVEAATRALEDKSPNKIRMVVDNMTNKTFIDGQLDECDLTLRDLHDIVDAFTRILVGIYHQRIEYPEIPGGEEKSGRQGIYEGRDKYLKQEPLPDTAAQEATRTPLKPVRNIRDS